VLYLLDTNTISDLIKNPDGIVTRKIRHVGEVNIATSIIVAAELRFGAEKSGSLRLARKVDQALERFGVIPFGSAADQQYARIRTELESRGTPIGANDPFIAAHALALNLTLVTDNVREFSRIDGLTVENWLRQDPAS
jgi:tRNA(fMet)-specific endonuclease VapC